MGGPFGLDMGSIMMMASAQGLDLPMLSEVLPDIERVIIDALCDEGEEPDLTDDE